MCLLHWVVCSVPSNLAANAFPPWQAFHATPQHSSHCPTCAYPTPSCLQHVSSSFSLIYQIWAFWGRLGGGLGQNFLGWAFGIWPWSQERGRRGKYSVSILPQQQHASSRSGILITFTQWWAVHSMGAGRAGWGLGRGGLGECIQASSSASDPSSHTSLLPSAAWQPLNLIFKHSDPPALNMKKKRQQNKTKTFHYCACHHNAVVILGRLCCFPPYALPATTTTPLVLALYHAVYVYMYASVACLADISC